MSKKIAKTNVMRILDSAKIKYNQHLYPVVDGHVDGVSVANHIGKDCSVVYKTLVAQGHSKSFYVFVIPVAENLDLKKASRSCGEKNIEMIHVKDINKVTGYIRGGCSPIGMKKQYKTFIDESASNIDEIIVSAGKIGYQVELSVEDLIKATGASLSDIVVR